MVNWPGSSWSAASGARQLIAPTATRPPSDDDGRCGFRLVEASADNVPLPDASFDIVFCDHGGMTFVDPYRTVPEAARLLRPGGLLAFNMATPLVTICNDPATDRLTTCLHTDYFGLHRFAWPDWTVEFQLPYGEWIRLFRRHGLVIENLIELRPPEGATTTYDFAPFDWARRWPAEHIWIARNQADWSFEQQLSQ